MYIKLPRFWIH